MKVTPLTDRVLIKIIEAETKTANGIFIPETASKNASQRGVVIDRGEARTVENGDIVIYEKYAGTSVKIDGEDHLLVELKNILAIVEENN